MPLLVFHQCFRTARQQLSTVCHRSPWNLIETLHTSTRTPFIRRFCGFATFTRNKFETSKAWNKNTNNNVRHISQTPRRAIRDKLPFEVEADFSRDIKIFSYTNDKMYRMMTVFGIVQFFFWGNLALFSYSTFKKFKKDDSAYVADSWSGSVIQSLSTHSYKISAMCMLLGHIVLAFTFIYPLRTVSRLVIQRGGRDVKVTTYSHFGKKVDFTVPLEHISCHQSRVANTSQVSLKVKDKWMYFLMDKRDGVFHNPQLFDQVVGLKRDLKLKN